MWGGDTVKEIGFQGGDSRLVQQSSNESKGRVEIRAVHLSHGKAVSTMYSDTDHSISTSVRRKQKCCIQPIRIWGQSVSNYSVLKLLYTHGLFKVDSTMGVVSYWSMDRFIFFIVVIYPVQNRQIYALLTYHGCVNSGIWCTLSTCAELPEHLIPCKYNGSVADYG